MAAFADLDSSDRISLLLEWWAYSGKTTFARGARAIALKPPRAFTSWRDGAQLLKIIGELHDPGHYEPGPEANELTEALEEIVVQLFEDGMGSDELLRMSDMVENGEYSERVQASSHAAINQGRRLSGIPTRARALVSVD